MIEVYDFGFKPEGYEGPAISVENHTYRGYFPGLLLDETEIFAYKKVYFGWERVGRMVSGEPVFDNSEIEEYYEDTRPYDDGPKAEK
jgi:hypothetical protein